MTGEDRALARVLFAAAALAGCRSRVGPDDVGKPGGLPCSPEIIAKQCWTDADAMLAELDPSLPRSEP